MTESNLPPLGPVGFFFALAGIVAATLSGLWMLFMLLSTVGHGFVWSAGELFGVISPFALSVSVIWLASRYGRRPALSPNASHLDDPGAGEPTESLGPVASTLAFLAALTMIFSGGCTLALGPAAIAWGAWEMMLVWGGGPFLAAALVLWLSWKFGRRPANRLPSSSTSHLR